MKKTMLLCVGLLLSAPLLHAQYYQWRAAAPRLTPKWVATANVWEMVPIGTPFLQAGIMRHLVQNLYLQAEAGSAVHALSLLTDVSNGWGVAARLQPRYYPGGIVRESPNFFIAADAQYEFTDVQQTSWFLRGGGSFRQELEYSYVFRKTTVGISAGLSRFISRRWMVDATLGYGYRFSYGSNEGIPADAELDTTDIDFWQLVPNAIQTIGFTKRGVFTLSARVCVLLSEVERK